MLSEREENERVRERGGNNNNNNNNKIHTQTHSESTTKTFRDVFFSPARSPAVRRTHNWSKAKKRRECMTDDAITTRRGEVETSRSLGRRRYRLSGGIITLHGQDERENGERPVSLSCSSISSHPTRGDVTAAGQKKKKSTETQRERERESGSFRLPSSWWKSSLIHLNDVGPPHGAGN